MQRVFAISLNTFRESVRQKVFLIIVIFGFFILIASFFLFPLSVGEQSKIIRDFGLSAITFLNILVIIIIGATLIHKEIEKRTIYSIVVSPVKRKEIIIGKFFGLFAVVLINIVAMEFFHQILVFFTDRKPDFSLFIALLPFIFEAGILVSIMIFLSSFSSYTFSSFIGVMLYIIGHLTASLKEFAEISKISFLKLLSYLFYYILPNLENFNIKTEIVYKEIPCINYFIFSLSYGLIWIIFLLFVSGIIFEKREFK